MLKSEKLQETIKHNNDLILLGLYLKGKDKQDIDRYSLFFTLLKGDGKKDIDFLAFSAIPELKSILSGLNFSMAELKLLFSDYNLNGYPTFTQPLEVEKFNKKLEDANSKITPSKNTALLDIIKSNANIITPGFTGSPFDTPLLTMPLLFNMLESPKYITAQYLFSQ